MRYQPLPIGVVPRGAAGAKAASTACGRNA